MRLKIIFGKKDVPLEISRDYRRYFISFLKKVFTKSGEFENLYSFKKLKPFTFSIFLGDKFEMIEDKEEKMVKVVPPFNLVFSTGDLKIFTNFYNGVLDLKNEKEGVHLEGKNFPIEEILLEKNVKINTDTIIFKTAGICVLTDPDEDAKDFERWFIVPCQENIEKFNEVLEKRTLEKYRIIIGEKINTKIKFIPLKTKEIYVKHYDGFLKGFKSVFVLQSHPQILQFVYDYGLGVRTGQGFGLLEIIKQL